MLQYCRLQYEAMVISQRLKELKALSVFKDAACHQLHVDASTNTDQDPMKFNPFDMGPKHTLEGCANRQAIIEHEVQWLRDHSLSTLSSLTNRLAALERAMAQISAVQVPWAIR